MLTSTAKHQQEVRFLADKCVFLSIVCDQPKTENGKGMSNLETQEPSQSPDIYQHTSLEIKRKTR